MRKYQSREATESQPALSQPKETRKRATPSAASRKAAPAGTAVRERPHVVRAPRVVARIPSLATSDPALAAEGPKGVQAGWLSAVRSRKMVLGAVVLLVGFAVITAIWQFNRGTEDKDRSATATHQAVPGEEMYTASTPAAPWAGAAADATPDPLEARRRLGRAGQAPSGRYSPYDAAEATVLQGAAARWDNPSDALPTATEYPHEGDRSWSSRPRMPASYSDSLEAERPELADAGYAPSSGRYSDHGVIGDAERWLPPETGRGSRNPAGLDDRSATSRQSGPGYRTASRSEGWRIGTRDENPQGRSSAGSTYPSGSIEGTYPSTDYPPVTGLPRASVGPRSGASTSANARDAGAARFDGTIQKPPTRTSSYERTGSSVY